MGHTRYATNNPYKFIDPDGRTELSPFMERNFPKGDIFRAAGEAMGALAAYGVGVATNDQVLQNTAIEGMRENVKPQDGLNAAMMAVSPRGGMGGPKGAIEAPVASAPDFVVTPGGTAFPVPKGATGPTPSINPSGKVTGSAFTGGKGGANGQVSSMRIMDPNAKNPSGYIKYENSQLKPQGVDPYTGRTLKPEEAHFPIDR